MTRVSGNVKRDHGTSRPTVVLENGVGRNGAVHMVFRLRLTAEKDVVDILIAVTDKSAAAAGFAVDRRSANTTVFVLNV